MERWIATNGDDSNPASYYRPVRTAARAQQLAQPGDRIVFRGGMYRESIVTTVAGITVCAADGERATLRGSVPIDPTTITKDGQHWCFQAPARTIMRKAVGTDFLTADEPLAHVPEMVFVDGLQLRQVNHRDKLVPGRFFIDATDRVYLADDPTSVLVEMAVLPQAIKTAAQAVITRLEIMHYATHRENWGTVCLDANGSIAEHNDIHDNASTGLFALTCTGAQMRNNKLWRNGLQACGAYMSDDLVVEGNEAYENKWKLWSGWEGGFMKFSRSKRARIEHNHVHHNVGNGVWADVHNEDATIRSNRVHDNTGHGIYYEISTRAVIADNDVRNNGGFGVYVSECTGGLVHVLRNIIAGNENAQWALHQGARGMLDQVVFERNAVAVDAGQRIGSSTRTAPAATPYQPWLRDNLLFGPAEALAIAAVTGWGTMSTRIGVDGASPLQFDDLARAWVGQL